jgi:hypothetical protein
MMPSPPHTQPSPPPPCHRLICAEDHAWFRAQQCSLLQRHFATSYTEVAPQDRLIYGDYLVPGAEVRPYTQIFDLTRLQHLVEEYLEEYNGSSSKPMRLVMFLDAIEHVSRICRVIRLPQGAPGRSALQALCVLAMRPLDWPEQCLTHAATMVPSCPSVWQNLGSALWQLTVVEQCCRHVCLQAMRCCWAWVAQGARA